MINDVDNITSYAMSHNSADVLRRRSSSLSVIESIGLIHEEIEGHAHRHLEMMEEGINPAFNAWLVIECVAVEIAELRYVTF